MRCLHERGDKGASPLLRTEEGISMAPGRSVLLPSVDEAEVDGAMVVADENWPAVGVRYMGAVFDILVVKTVLKGKSGNKVKNNE